MRIRGVVLSSRAFVCKFCVYTIEDGVRLALLLLMTLRIDTKQM